MQNNLDRFYSPKMIFDVFRPKRELKIYYFPSLKIVKRSLNKLFRNLKKHPNLGTLNQRKYFHLHNPSRLKDLGLLN